ncbi:hypothetical protein B0H21DRAFT_839637 [Amylocystis lapponica]|nr:hypothetical protein B0H21DRAFT_839637 [Amylocystis lapponica]
MITAFHEVAAVTQPILIHAPRPMLALASYQKILEGKWDLQYDCQCRNQHNTEEEHKHSAPVVFSETALSSLRIDSPRVVSPGLDQPENPGRGLESWGHSESEWMPCSQERPNQLTGGRERHHVHNTSSSFNSLSSLPSLSSLETILSLPQLDAVEIDTTECDDIVYIGSHPHVAEVPRWSDEMLERSPAVPIPPTPVIVPSLLPDVLPTTFTGAVVVDEVVQDGSTQRAQG